MKNPHLWSGIVLLCFLFLAGGSADTDSSSSRTTPSRTTTAPRPSQMTSPLEMMETVFVGGHSRSEIKARMDRVMPLYNLSITEENYERAGSSLVSLRKETGVGEMAILQCMLEMHVDGLNWQFPSSAALCATTLSL